MSLMPWQGHGGHGRNTACQARAVQAQGLPSTSWPSLGILPLRLGPRLDLSLTAVDQVIVLGLIYISFPLYVTLTSAFAGWEKDIQVPANRIGA
eukprot:1779396-Alexandrium_andersonii.AAC.1